MPQWIVELVGESLAQIVWVAIVATLVCILAVAMILLARRAFGGSGGVSGAKARGPRLAIVDVLPVDQRRRLVLLRRDGVEHLVLIGGQNDLIVEAAIGRPNAEPRPAYADQRGQVPSVDAPPSRQVVRRPPADAGSASADRPPLPLPVPRRTPATALAAEPVRPAPQSPEVVSAPPVVAAESRAAAPAVVAAVAAERVAPPPAPERAPVGKTKDEPRPEPSLAPPVAASLRSAPEPKITPPPVPAVAKPVSQDAQASLRATMNQPQGSPLASVSELTAPAIAVGTRDGRAENEDARRPLSVQSFASAIQSRKGPAEMPAPETSAETALAKPSPAAAPPPVKAPVAREEPSLEDFLSAELDSDFGNDSSFGAETTAKPAVASATPKPATPAETVLAALASRAKAESTAPSPEPVKPPVVAAAPWKTDPVAPPPAPPQPVETEARREDVAASRQRDVEALFAPVDPPKPATPDVPPAGTPLGGAGQPAAEPVRAPPVEERPLAPEVAPPRPPQAAPAAPIFVRAGPQPAPVAPPVVPPVASPIAPASSQSEAPRKLTLEEEMERLLGDFSFDEPADTRR